MPRTRCGLRPLEGCEERARLVSITHAANGENVEKPTHKLRLLRTICACAQRSPLTQQHSAKSEKRMPMVRLLL